MAGAQRSRAGTAGGLRRASTMSDAITRMATVAAAIKSEVSTADLLKHGRSE
jgi:hypothetical protein